MLEGMIFAGCFDSLGLKRSQLAAVCERVLKTAQDAKRRNVEGQMSLFDAMPAEQAGDTDDFEDIPEYSKDKLLAIEKLATGVYLSGHPLDRYKKMLENRNINIYKIMSATEDVDSARYFESRDVELIGILSGIRRRSTKLKKMMANALLEDLYGTIEMVIFPSAFQKVEPLLVDDAIVYVTGKVDIREGEAPQLLVDEIKPFVIRDEKYAGKKLFVRVPRDMGDDTVKLKQILKTSPGEECVSVVVEKTGQKMKTCGALGVTLTDALIQSLEAAYGKDNVVLG
jgi:DNA polymerase-3 subunit alpha